ncbi:MAG TPA: GGDEF domain-containing protein [Gemmatimonadaceae bacterium]|nr:GGDEF domain-containing protein [Gemmatimonadaceae bacterium]
MSDEATTIEGTLLGRVLTDPQTGLPSAQYFRIIREWEERRAKRRGYCVRVARISVNGGEDRVRLSLAWRFCSEFRTSDLLASDGPGRYQLLLTSPDAEQAESFRERLQRLVASINEAHPFPDPLTVSVEFEPERAGDERGPCAIPPEDRLRTPPEHPRYDPAG